MTWGEEDHLGAEEKLLQTICNGALDAFCLFDQEGHIIVWNTTLEDLLGHSIHDILGRDIHQFLPQIGCPDSFSDGPFPLFWIARHKDGAKLPVEMSITPVYVQDHWYGLVIVHKASNLTQSEKELRRTKRSAAKTTPESYEYDQKLSNALKKVKEAEKQDRASRLRFLSMVEASSDWIWETNASDAIVYSSSAVQSILGRELNSMVGMTFGGLVTSEKQRPLSEKLLYALSTRKPFKNIEATFSNREGRPVKLDFNGVPLTDENGTFTGYQGIARDITQRTEIEFELRQAQKLESVGQMASGIAHEINTPIQFIGDSVMFLRDAFKDIMMLLEKYQSTAKGTGTCTSIDPDQLSNLAQAEEDADLKYLTENIPSAIERILDGVERVATIVRAMKEFAHPDVREKSAIDVNKAIQSTLTVARNEYKYVANVETFFGDVPSLLGYAGEFNQVILNLLINATHSISDVVKDSGKKGTITIRTSVEDKNILIEIQDTGSGIPEEIRHKIFDPFFTTKEVGRGTGQGLMIAHTVIVDKHKGSISFDSEVGKGTTFFIRLPLEDVEETQKENPPNQ